MDSRFDKDVDSLFSRFQKGVQLLKKEPKLFRGLLYMSVKDVNMNDRQGVVDELSVKLDRVFEANKAQNFLTEMYAGQLVINCTPPFGTTEYYQSMENDVLKRLCHIVSLLDQPLAGFATGKTFLDCFRLVLSKISILDWTSMEKDTEHLLIVDANEKLPGILRTGCCVAHSLVADPSIPSHLKEDVVRVGTREKIVIFLENVCQAYPERASMWRSLGDVVSLDDINDESLDFGFDVTMPGGTKCGTIHKALVVHFHRFSSLRGVGGDTSKLVVGDQLSFDAFLVFALRRSKEYKYARKVRLSVDLERS
ncbi:unnamed protein product [Hyaloperonospora brassicae]|uniref:Uncharacterized protein n=2 Tax=Hyaloperonospora brassicae TaxID=162125 RepID=A0AAV0U0S3_HYABA|nr:unnamed protein product [Hyaloperonospora brassicae]